MRAHPVIGVLAGCGGAGASVFAAVLAGQAAQRDRHSFLIDCDPAAGGLDVLLGCEQLPGPRWSQVRLAGGALDPAVLVDSLPRWRQVSFLSADAGQPPDPAAGRSGGAGRADRLHRGDRPAPGAVRTAPGGAAGL